MYFCVEEMTALEFLIIALLVFASAYLTASEIALFTLSRFQIRHLKERTRSHYRQIKRLLSDPSGLLITVLVVNEVLNTAISTVITRSVAQNIPVGGIRFLKLPDWGMHAILGTMITAPILLILCEATPKTVGARANQLIASLTVNTINVIYTLFKPIRAVLKAVVNAVSHLTEKPRLPIEDQQTLKEADFLLMVEEGHKEGAVQASEVELIKNVFELDDTTVADVFTPLSQVRTLTLTTTIREALVAVRTHRYSRIPVTSQNKREVVGILYSKDLLRAKLEAEQLSLPISEIMLDPVFVSPTIKLNALFRRFKQQRTHMAIVQKHSGEALGLITMSDVMDTLFDDLFPEEEE